MDRDKRWERIKLAYDLLVNGVGEPVEDFPEAIRKQFMKKALPMNSLKPMLQAELANQQAVIKDGDVVICFNFRTDRCREITQVLTQENHA